MTKEQWSDVKEDWLERIQLEFKIDNYEVVLQRGISKKGKYSYALFVNGFQSLEWSDGKSEQAKRFCQKRTRKLYSEKEKKQMILRIGIKAYNKDIERYEGTHVYWLPFWSNFNSFKKHIIANNNEIEFTNPLK